MARRIIDLSVTLTADIASDPPGMTPEIEYVDHDQGAVILEKAFGVPVEHQLERKGAAVEHVRMTTHAGTHMDAPWHYHPTMNHGEPSMRIDEVPLEWCIGPGVKLDFRNLPDGHVVTPDDIDAELARIGHELKPWDIVLVNTRAGARYGHPDFVASGCGMGRAATLHLTAKGIRVVGTDGWSWDPPILSQVARIKETGDWSLFWEGHKAGAETVFCHIEKLANLDQLPGTGFDVIALPVKVAHGSAGWCRPIAILHD